MFIANAICLVLCPSTIRATISFSLGDSSSSGFLGDFTGPAVLTQGITEFSTVPPAEITSSADAIWSTLLSLPMKPATPLPIT